MAVEAQVPADHPLMIAWSAYRATEDYANTRRWAAHEAHVDGSLWAAFVAGYSARSSGWQPIETAPKDGTRLLLAKFAGHPDHDTCLWWAVVGHWSDKWGNWNDGVEPCGLASPSHWMPVPRPFPMPAAE